MDPDGRGAITAEWELFGFVKPKAKEGTLRAETETAGKSMLEIATDAEKSAMELLGWKEDDLAGPSIVLPDSKILIEEVLRLSSRQTLCEVYDECAGVLIQELKRNKQLVRELSRLKERCWQPREAAQRVVKQLLSGEITPPYTASTELMNLCRVLDKCGADEGPESPSYELRTAVHKIDQADEWLLAVPLLTTLELWDAEYLQDEYMYTNKIHMVPNFIKMATLYSEICEACEGNSKLVQRYISDFAYGVEISANEMAYIANWFTLLKYLDLTPLTTEDDLENLMRVNSPDCDLDITRKIIDVLSILTVHNEMMASYAASGLLAIQQTRDDDARDQLLTVSQNGSDLRHGSLWNILRSSNKDVKRDWLAYGAIQATAGGPQYSMLPLYPVAMICCSAGLSDVCLSTASKLILAADGNEKHTAYLAGKHTIIGMIDANGFTRQILDTLLKLKPPLRSQINPSDMRLQFFLLHRQLKNGGSAAYIDHWGKITMGTKSNLDFVKPASTHLVDAFADLWSNTHTEALVLESLRATTRLADTMKLVYKLSAHPKTRMKHQDLNDLAASSLEALETIGLSSRAWRRMVKLVPLLFDRRPGNWQKLLTKISKSALKGNGLGATDIQLLKYANALEPETAVYYFPRGHDNLSDWLGVPIIPTLRLGRPALPK
jgi:hypothetical protein